MANPFESPTETSRFDPQITDATVRQLINGDNVEILAFYDVSDRQVYGRKHRRNLEGLLAAGAQSVGYAPRVYQTVLWFCIAYLPIWPMATYFVMPFSEYDDSHDEAVRYRAVLAPSDPSQIASQSVVLCSIAFVVGATIWYCLL